MKNKYLLLAICLLWVTSWVSGQVKYANWTYQDYIKSVNITVNGEVSHIPSMHLDLNDFMVITFDDLSNSEDDIYYRIIHCDRDWNKSNISEIDYVEGYHEELIRTWDFSANTEVEYTHLFLQLPNRDTRFKISGNYILYVFMREDSKEVPLFTRRFVITEDYNKGYPKFARASDVSQDRYIQQFDITALIPAKVQNPMNDVTMELVQNGLWSESIKNVKPFNYNNGSLKFDPFGSISIPGHAEYRSFDTRLLTGGGRGIRDMILDYGKVTAFVDTGYIRKNVSHIFQFDFNGNFITDAFNTLRTAENKFLQNGSFNELRREISYSARFLDGRATILDKDLVGNYIDVNFTLVSPYLERDVYIYGAFTDWALKPEFKMTYDEVNQVYTGHALLKQGFYDYMYATDNDGHPEFGTTEGSWNETENDYTLLIYFREFGTRYDRLLSVTKYNSLGLVSR